ncbi:MAG: helix-turn-helix domain-containing protein [Syntrophaceae bacterium]|nr:helix-turn-helix domain-containing protein [Syntrophaceae bacterium]
MANDDQNIGKPMVFTVAEVAETLKCSRKTIYRYAAAGYIGIKFGGQYRFRSDEIDNVIRNGVPTIHQIFVGSQGVAYHSKPGSKVRSNRAWDRKG